MTTFLTRSLLAATAALAMTAGAGAQDGDAVKVGLVLSLSGSGAVLGNEMRKGADLALEQSEGTLGGLQAELIYEDDQLKPDVGKQAAEKLVRSDKVDFVIGPSFSNVMMAVQRPVVRSGTILISPNPAPAPMAGAQCDPNYFAIPFQNDQPSEALGKYLTDQGVKTAYILGPNYQAGKDILGGFKRTFEGEIVGEVYTPLEQTDFSAELTAAKSAAPEAVFAFYPGGLGIQFMKQYDQAGMKAETPLYTAFTVFNGASLDAIGASGLGTYAATQWTVDLNNAANEAFVTAFEEKYDTLPSAFAAMAYDAVRLIDGSIEKAGGSIEDMDAVREAMKSAPFESVRGDFAFNTNNHPIQTMYLAEVQEEDGQYVLHETGTIVEKMPDSYVSECSM